MAATSIHIKPVKGGSEQHNKREKKLDYVREELSHRNEYWESDTQSHRLAAIKERYSASTGQKMQAKSTPIREGVVVISHLTTMGELKKLADAYHQAFGITVFQIAIHRDEGHVSAKQWVPNLHAHMVIDWTGADGKSIKLNRDDMARMQSITADVLHMARGRSSEKKHLDAIQYKVAEREREVLACDEHIKSSKEYMAQTNAMAQDIARKAQQHVKNVESALESLKSAKIELSSVVAERDKVAAELAELRGHLPSLPSSGHVVLAAAKAGIYERQLVAGVKCHRIDHLTLVENDKYTYGNADKALQDLSRAGIDPSKVTEEAWHTALTYSPGTWQEVDGCNVHLQFRRDFGNGWSMDVDTPLSRRMERGMGMEL